MARLSLSEQYRVSKLAAGRARRRMLTRALYSPALRWRYGSNVADQLLIVPQDLHTSDPSFFHEIHVGQFGLAGSLATLDGRSPFDLKPQNIAWSRALHGFEWLRHLAAAEEIEARDVARRLAVDWATRHHQASSVAWEPAVMARRMISWITHAGLLLEDADAKTFDVIAESLGYQLVKLSATWRMAPVGAPRLLTLMAIVLADLSIAGHERQLRDAEAKLSAELSRQILGDGGHISRNPALLIELMLDLLPLSQCFVARGMRPPAQLMSAIERMLAMLRYMRMGDGCLARFNGVSVPAPAHLATVLAYDDLGGQAVHMTADQSCFARISRGSTILIADVGSPPPLEYAGAAHAGCLSFEVSVGRQLVLVNGGAPGSADAEWLHRARATVSHNTLCIGEKSSSKMVRHPFLEELAGAPPIRYPEAVSYNVSDVKGLDARIEAHHDGYARRFGLIHHRWLSLSPDGKCLKGVDRIAGANKVVRLNRDLPFSIHFHLDPEIVMLGPGSEPGTLAIELPDRSVWNFSAEGGDVSVEESIHFADSAGPTRTLQIVVRGATNGASEVSWQLVAADRAKDPQSPPPLPATGRAGDGEPNR
jgi:uncharacterized heparinase superfamily protein